MSCEATIRSYERVKKWAAGLNWQITVLRFASTGSIYTRFEHRVTRAWLWVRFSDHEAPITKYRLDVRPGGTPLKAVLRELVYLAGGKYTA